MPVMTPHGEILTAADSARTPSELYELTANNLRRRRAAGLGFLPELPVPQLNDLVKGVEIRSQITPTVSYTADQFFDPPPSVARYFLREVVKPEVIVKTNAGPISVAPYGPPERNLFPVIAVFGVVGALTTAYFVARGVGLVK